MLDKKPIAYVSKMCPFVFVFSFTGYDEELQVLILNSGTVLNIFYLHSSDAIAYVSTPYFQKAALTSKRITLA